MFQSDLVRIWTTLLFPPLPTSGVTELHGQRDPQGGRAWQLPGVRSARGTVQPRCPAPPLAITVH